MGTHCALGQVPTALLVALLACSAMRSAGASAPDYARLDLQGDGMAQDSVSLSVVAAADLLGHDADYLAVFCRSTNAFAPAIDPAEPCTSWWHVASWLGTRTMRPLARSLGLTARKLRLPACESEAPEALQAHRREVAAVIQRELLAGRVVLIEREWQTDGPHGFVPWAWAGIVTDADPATGLLRGACLNGHHDNRIAFIEGAWTLSLARTTSPPLDADLEMLRLAVARIRGETPFRAFRRGVFGLQAMDLWIRQMAEVPGFCAECQERSQRGWTDARDNAVRMNAGAQAAAAYLRLRAPSFPAAVRPWLEGAARRYEGIEKLLHPALTGDGGETFEQFVGDTAKQRAYASGVLTAVRKELSAAADYAEAALTAAEVVPGQVRPEALAALDAQPYEGNEVAYSGAGVPLAYARALSHAGTPIGYSDFAAMCGWAFSFGYAYDDRRTACMAVCGAPGRDGPCEVFRWLTERLGYEYEGVPVAEAEKFVAFVKRHVDAGTPLLTDQMDGGLIYGYRQEDGVQQVWFGGPVGAGWLAPGDFQGPVWVYALKRKGEPMARRQLYREALARAIGKASPHDWEGVPQGLAALKAYRQDLADPARDFVGRDTWFCWATFERLSARHCCAAWLEKAAGVLGGAARAPLLAAADHYQRAFAQYDGFRKATGAGEPNGQPLAQLRTPEGIAAILLPLDRGIDEERAGIQDMERALAVVAGG